MSKKIASLYAELTVDPGKFESGMKKTKGALDAQAAAFQKFSANASRDAKSFMAYEAQKAKAIAATERAAAKLAKEQERAARAAAKAAEEARRQSMIIAPGIERGTKGIQEFAQANMGLISVATVAAGAVLSIGAAIGKTINQVVEYGDQVQKLKTITGQSAEETSRQIQLADDVRVSYDSLAVSLQFAAKKGVDTSINGLAKLADQYKTLKPGIEQTQFLTDKFGKSGVELAKILSMDSAALRELAASQPDGLILNEQDLADIREYNKQLDQMNDTLQTFYMTAGKTALPVATAGLESATGYIRMLDLMKNKQMSLSEAWRQAHDEMYQNRKEFEKLDESAQATSESIDGLVDPLQAAAESGKALSAVYTGLLSSMFAVQKQVDSYDKTIASITKKDGELAAQKNQLTLKMWEEQRAGKMTNEENLKYVQQLDEITQAQAENAQAREDAAKDNEKASKQRIYDLAQQKFAADGLIESGEFDYLQNLAVQYGLVSRAAADQAMKENQLADQMVANFQKTQPAMSQTLNLMQQIAGYNGTVVNFGVNFQTNRPAGNTFGMNGINYSQSFRPGQGSPMNVPMQSRDSGGPGIAGTPYQIGTPEIYVPKTGGEFVPLGGAKDKIGNVTNIVNVYNPKKETAENSVRQQLKKLSYLGTAS